MAKNAKWSDDYWLLLMQIYLQKPVGVKPMFHRKMVDLSLELHMPPNFLFNKMCQIANLETPRIEHIWETYGRNPKKLARAVSLWREMRGYGHADAFYEGVEVQETFERDFKPVNKETTMTPVTMVPETPEVQELAKLIKVRPQEVIEIMKLFQYCDPYLNRKDQPDSTLLAPCQEIWRRYGNAETEQLAAYAEQLKEYFRS